MKHFARFQDAIFWLDLTDALEELESNNSPGEKNADVMTLFGTPWFGKEQVCFDYLRRRVSQSGGSKVWLAHNQFQSLRTFEWRPEVVRLLNEDSRVLEYLEAWSGLAKKCSRSDWCCRERRLNRQAHPGLKFVCVTVLMSVLCEVVFHDCATKKARPFCLLVAAVCGYHELLIGPSANGHQGQDFWVKMRSQECKSISNLCDEHFGSQRSDGEPWACW